MKTAIALSMWNHHRSRSISRYVGGDILELVARRLWWFEIDTIRVTNERIKDSIVDDMRRL